MSKQLELEVPGKGSKAFLTDLRQAIESGDLERARKLLGVKRVTARHLPYKHSRWARCMKCLRKQQVAVYAKPGMRLRDQRCSCGGRLHVLTWTGWSSACSQ